MRNCTSIDSLVTPFIDGELSATERAVVEEHLHRCAACSARVAAEGAVRDLMRARRTGLTAERASASLRMQCRDLARREAVRPGGVSASPAPAAHAGWRAPWRTRWAPLALTASFVLLIAGA